MGRVLFSLYSLEIQLVFLDVCWAGTGDTSWGIRERTPALPKSLFYPSCALQHAGSHSPLQLSFPKLDFLFITINSIFKFTASAGFRKVWEV